MIRSFANKEARQVWNREYAKKLPNEIQKRARNKSILIHRAKGINDLRSPPGNRLEKLYGDRASQWSIRINQQWRICFDWEENTDEAFGHAYNVEIVDYH